MSTITSWAVTSAQIRREGHSTRYVLTRMFLGAQMNMTDSNIGYLVMDLDKAVSHEVEAALRELPTSIKTRILY